MSTTNEAKTIAKKGEVIEELLVSSSGLLVGVREAEWGRGELVREGLG